MVYHVHSYYMALGLNAIAASFNEGCQRQI